MPASFQYEGDDMVKIDMIFQKIKLMIFIQKTYQEARNSNDDEDDEMEEESLLKRT